MPALQLVQRAVSENRAGRCLVDGFATVAAELETLHREKLLLPVKTPATADLAPLAFRPHGEWVATRLNIFSASYNTNLVKREEAPKTYEDLKDPRWRKAVIKVFGTLTDLVHDGILVGGPKMTDEAYAEYTALNPEDVTAEDFEAAQDWLYQTGAIQVKSMRGF